MNKEVSFARIKELWENKIFQSTETFNLYIDSPFCIQRCEFCVHFGSKTKIGSEVYNKYYKEYLPQMIDMFSFILNKHVPDTIYFGGGTASLMTNEIMEDIFNRIPNFMLSKERAFEAHPAFLNRDKIEIFKKYKFDYLTLGIQTLNGQVLSKNNRIPQRDKVLPELIDIAQDAGIIVNCDLLAYIDTGTLEDTKLLYNDLCLLAEKYKPQSITIYPMYQRFKLDFDSENFNELSNEDIEHDCELKKQIFRQILKFTYKYNNYTIYQKDSIEFKDNKKLINNVYNDIYLISISEQEFEKRKIYNCSSYPSHPSEQNVLGLGGYGNRAPYSYFGRKIYYNTKNDNWNPKFVIKHEEK